MSLYNGIETNLNFLLVQQIKILNICNVSRSLPPAGVLHSQNKVINAGLADGWAEGWAEGEGKGEGRGL